ncbi:hypothetical protein [Parasitella parasitica]|uniref:Uncharacterized protein n=1 Tax=Parasitella parasitica TaxID=35722 RepID=A0A0B7N069_9FUNG|nr:hypothetical protein [Parasitella parasitica]
MVVEYCSISNLQEREQYWMNILHPEYSVLNHAFSPQGYKHIPESIKLMMSQSAVSRVHSEETSAAHRPMIQGAAVSHDADHLQILSSPSEVLYSHLLLDICLILVAFLLQ